MYLQIRLSSIPYFHRFISQLVLKTFEYIGVIEIKNLRMVVATGLEPVTLAL